MRTIYAICDYKNHFGTKYTAVPYRSGMNKNLLNKYFSEKGFRIEFIQTGNFDFSKQTINRQIFIYTSSEDKRGLYKSFLNDLILALELSGGIVIPRHMYMHAHENKVFFELLRQLSKNNELNFIKSKCFGTFEEMEKFGKFDFPVVLKSPMGSKSRGVFLANNQEELNKTVKKISNSKFFYHDLKDFVRALIHKNYIKESFYRNKFLIQSFIPNLNNDWKVLVYGDKYYCLKRRNRKNDFRASGGGLLSYEESIPEGMLDFAKKIKEYFNIPQISLDVAFDGTTFYLIEAQFVYFGTYTLEYSSFYFQQKEGRWKIVREKSILEREYANSIVNYIEENKL